MAKDLLRKIALKGRCKVDVEKISFNVINKIKESNILKEYKRVGIYYPIGKEINPLGLIEIYQDTTFYLPRINSANELEFALFSGKLRNGIFHTLEPTTPSIDINTLDCIIIPCVGISNGRRIGYGKGYYDKALAKYQGLKIGLCYKNAIFTEDIDNYDIQLDLIFEGE